jgi:hypothetical protein
MALSEIKKRKPRITDQNTADMNYRTELNAKLAKLKERRKTQEALIAKKGTADPAWFEMYSEQNHIMTQIEAVRSRIKNINTAGVYLPDTITIHK